MKTARKTKEMPVEKESAATISRFASTARKNTFGSVILEKLQYACDHGLIVNLRFKAAIVKALVCNRSVKVCPLQVYLRDDLWILKTKIKEYPVSRLERVIITYKTFGVSETIEQPADENPKGLLHNIVLRYEDDSIAHAYDLVAEKHAVIIQKKLSKEGKGLPFIEVLVPEMAQGRLAKLIFEMNGKLALKEPAEIRNQFYAWLKKTVFPIKQEAKE